MNLKQLIREVEKLQKLRVKAFKDNPEYWVKYDNIIGGVKMTVEAVDKLIGVLVEDINDFPNVKDWNKLKKLLGLK